MFRAILFALLTLAAARGAAAQSSLGPEAQAQKARLDSMLQELRAAKRAMHARDSIQRAARIERGREKLDSMVIAPFIIVSPQSVADETFPMVRRGIERKRRLLGGAAQAPAITLLVEKDTQYPEFRGMRKVPRHRLITLYRDPENNELILSRSLDNAVIDYAPQAVRVWLQDLNVSRGRELDRVYRQLATSSAATTRRCMQRSVPDCIIALGLGESFDSLQIYTPVQLRSLVARGSGIGTAHMRAMCVDGRVHEQCIALFRPYGGPPLPITKQGRFSFFIFAVERGGVGALERLRTSNGSAADALAAAANTPLETVVREWRAAVEDAQPIANTGTGRAGFMAVIWTVIVSFLSLRSTRRRAG